jgi:hypothetical protein
MSCTQKDVQLTQQQQHPDPDHLQGRNDAGNVSLESPIVVWLHEFSIGWRLPYGPLEIGEHPGFTGDRTVHVARTALDAR